MMKVSPNSQDVWYLLINPLSGGNIRSKLYLKLTSLLEEYGIAFHKNLTQKPLHASELVQSALKQGYRKFILSGGDGTFNEVINGLFQQSEVPTDDVTFAMVPGGTGNDWIKTIYGKEDLKQIIHLIQEEETTLLDVGQVSFFNETQSSKKYFLNIAGTGFDTYVYVKYLKDNPNKGKLSYLLALIKGLTSFSAPQMKVKLANGKEIKGAIFLAAVGICQYFGNGMRICPKAIPNDGLFDLTLVKDINKWKVVRKIRCLFTGDFKEMQEVSIHRTPSLSIHASESNPLFLQADGEMMGHTPFQFSIIPKSLKVITGIHFSSETFSSET